jgi:hypothetical protein
MKKNQIPPADRLQMTVIEKGLLSLPPQSLIVLVMAILTAAKDQLNLTEIAMTVLGKPNEWAPALLNITETIKYKTKTLKVERKFLSIDMVSAYPVNYTETTITNVFCKTQEDAQYIMNTKYLANKPFEGEPSEEFAHPATLKESRNVACTIEDWMSWENNTTTVPTVAGW